MGVKSRQQISPVEPDAERTVLQLEDDNSCSVFQAAYHLLQRYGAAWFCSEVFRTTVDVVIEFSLPAAVKIRKQYMSETDQVMLTPFNHLITKQPSSCNCLHLQTVNVGLTTCQTVKGWQLVEGAAHLLS